MIRTTILICLIFSLPGVSYGQDLKAEVYLKGMLLLHEDIVASSTNLTRRLEGAGGGTLQLMYNLNSNISVGGFYSRMIGERGAELVPTSGSSATAMSELQSYGLAVQAGTNRYKRFAIYATVNFFAAQLTDSYSKADLGTDKDLKFGKSGTGFSGGFGLLLKVSRRIGFNVFEAKAISYSGSLNYMNDKSFMGYSVESGFVYKFLKLK